MPRSKNTVPTGTATAARFDGLGDTQQHSANRGQGLRTGQQLPVLLSRTHPWGCRG